MTQKIYIARHGQDEDNAAGILNGHRDRTLTGIGKRQARELAEKIRNEGVAFEEVYSSPLLRAFETAAIISKAIGFKKGPYVRPDLIERNFGVMTGKPAEEIEFWCGMDTYRSGIIKTKTITYFLSPKGAETFPMLMERAKLVLEEMNKFHHSTSVLLVTHGDIGKMIYAVYHKLDWREVLTGFHFGNSDLLLLSKETEAKDAHVFRNQQYNH